MTRKFVSQTDEQLANLLDRLGQCSDPADRLRVWDERSFVSLDDWPRLDGPGYALFQISNALRLAGRLKEARTVANHVVSLARDIHSESLISAVQVVIGSIEFRAGNLRQARRAFTDALVASRRCDDLNSVCRAMIWLSFVEQSAGRLSSALDHAEECIEVAEKSELRTWHTSAMRLIGLYSCLQGRLKKAQSSFAEALLLECDKYEEARLVSALGFAQTLAGQFPEARQQIEKGRTLAIECGSIRDIAISYEYEAVLHLNQNNLAEAEKSVKEAVRISLEEFPDSDMTSQSYRIWGEIDVKRGDYVLAREHATDALGVARRVGERIEIGAIERILGQCDNAENENTSACKHFAEAISIHSDCGARYELALSHLAAGQADCFDRATQLSHLRSALMLFREMEVERFSLETEDAIRLLTSPPPSKQAISNGQPSIITCSKIVQENIADLDRFKNTSHTILLEGETGVGKDLLARYVHDTGNRANLPFVAFNAAAVPEALVESELFGHVKGSFTGAMRDREGLLFAAKNGTFFFNEIGEAPLSFQAKLLTMLETRKSRPVGSNAEKTIEARFIFATNRDLQKDVKAGKFRKDLFFRLCIARVTIPPLRDRPEDIELLLVSFLKREGLESSQIKELQACSEWKTLSHLAWDGNVRELNMFAQRLALEIQHDISVSSTRVLQRLLKSSFGLGAGSEVSVERVRITGALKKFDGNKRRAARELDMPESTLRWKIKNLDIQGD